MSRFATDLGFFPNPVSSAPFYYTNIPRSYHASSDESEPGSQTSGGGGGAAYEYHSANNQRGVSRTSYLRDDVPYMPPAPQQIQTVSSRNLTLSPETQNQGFSYGNNVGRGHLGGFAGRGYGSGPSVGSYSQGSPASQTVFLHASTPEPSLYPNVVQHAGHAPTPISSHPSPTSTHHQGAHYAPHTHYHHQHPGAVRGSAGAHQSLQAIYQGPSGTPSVNPFPFPTSAPQQMEEDEAGRYLRNRLSIPATARVDLSWIPDPPGGQKPSQALPVLVLLAIYGSPRKRLSLREIYRELENRFEYFRNNPEDKAWQRSIRHALSLYQMFVHVPRPITEPGKGKYWTIDVSKGEGYKRDRKRKGKQPGGGAEGLFGRTGGRQAHDTSAADDEEGPSNAGSASPSPEFPGATTAWLNQAAHHAQASQRGSPSPVASAAPGSSTSSSRHYPGYTAGHMTGYGSGQPQPGVAGRQPPFANYPVSSRHMTYPISGSANSPYATSSSSSSSSGSSTSTVRPGNRTVSRSATVPMPAMSSQYHHHRGAAPSGQASVPHGFHPGQMKRSTSHEELVYGAGSSSSGSIFSASPVDYDDFLQEDPDDDDDDDDEEEYRMKGKADIKGKRRAY